MEEGACFSDTGRVNMNFASRTYGCPGTTPRGGCGFLARRAAKRIRHIALGCVFLLYLACGTGSWTDAAATAGAESARTVASSANGGVARPAQRQRSGERLRILGLPTLASVWPAKPTIGAVYHALLLYGLGPTDLPGFPTGRSVLAALTDEATAIRVFGGSPFVRTTHGIRYHLAEGFRVGEPHRDVCLAAFAELNLPLSTPIHLKAGSYTIADLLSESVANFDPHEREPAWTAIAYAKYLAPKRDWVNRFGERASFSLLARRLLETDINSQSCGGTHILQALVAIQKSDDRHQILDRRMRERVDSYITAKLQQLVRRQQPDGSWGAQWCDAVVRTAPRTLFAKRVLITGHIGDAVLDTLPREERPPSLVYSRAARWLQAALRSRQLRPSNKDVCPFTHAARAILAALGPMQAGGLSPNPISPGRSGGSADQTSNETKERN